MANQIGHTQRDECNTILNYVSNKASTMGLAHRRMTMTRRHKKKTGTTSMNYQNPRPLSYSKLLSLVSTVRPCKILLENECRPRF